MSKSKGQCPRCGRPLEIIGGIPICPACSDKLGESYHSLEKSINAFADDSDKVLIECPGATLYCEGTGEISAGVRFHDPEDPSAGYEVVGHPVFGPRHVRHRWVAKEDMHLIRRCQSCQDYTIRMRRKEGPDLYIPPVKSRSSGARHASRNDPLSL